jgi:hypothetical protein
MTVPFTYTSGSVGNRLDEEFEARSPRSTSLPRSAAPSRAKIGQETESRDEAERFPRRH